MSIIILILVVFVCIHSFGEWNMERQKHVMFYSRAAFAIAGVGSVVRDAAAASVHKNVIHNLYYSFNNNMSTTYIIHGTLKKMLL